MPRNGWPQLEPALGLRASHCHFGSLADTKSEYEKHGSTLALSFYMTINGKGRVSGPRVFIQMKDVISVRSGHKKPILFALLLLGSVGLAAQTSSGLHPPEGVSEERFQRALERAESLQLVYRAINERVGASVVGVEPLKAPAQRGPKGDGTGRSGTGFIIDETGVIVTNTHVVGDSDEVRVKLFDGRLVAGTVRGRDSLMDITLIKIKPFPGIRAARLGDSRSLRVGDLCIAVGNPFGFAGSFTTGVVSALERGGLDGSGLRYIQTDASVNHGNSGGPLLNLRGEVIGINRMIVSPYGGSVGISFAIPINQVRTVIAQIRDRGVVERPMLGVRIAAPDGRSTPAGLPVEAVLEGSGAWKAGLEKGDIILHVDRRKMMSFHDLIAYVLTKRIGDVVTMEILRGQTKRRLNVRLTKR